ncbi:DUF1402 family protein [Stappia sp. ES.058]|uniref:DUF1402 family protein n=1 Tax=Stappia sp. ES.058 TaxID=1881061 RepID=UPI00087CF574|nr:DUF1402 family protein [Stappia sp. ES.058]SDU28659.1 Protein of unknown function [Stappia sp. ES.058]
MAPPPPRSRTRPIAWMTRLWATAAIAAAVTLAPLPVSKVLPLGSGAAQAARVVPEGNRKRSQPKIPFASSRRTAASKSAYDAKFDKIVAVLRRDSRLMRNIKSAANRYGIDPVHMLGAIVGEHTYNYDSLDSAQSYYVKALAYAGIRISFELNGEHVEDFVQRSQFDRCNKGKKESNTLWNCYQRYWNSRFRNKTVDGVRYPNKTFNEAFFQPLFAGQSFGLGQLSPLTVLKMSDRVSRVSGFRKLTARDAQEVYRATMDPAKSLHYMAAVLRDAIDAYKSVGGVDISKNPGLTATLYNLGDPWSRAAQYRRRRAAGSARWPSENYYGWLVNARIDVLRGLL